MPETYRKWIYARAMTDGVLRHDQFEMRELPMPDPAPGQAVARVKLINIHSATRARMMGGMTVLGDTDRSNYACAEIVRSRDAAFEEGDVIACQAGWQEYQLISSEDGSVGYAPPTELVKTLNGTQSQWNYVFRPAMVKMWSPEVLMEMFGTSGMTAYFGMRECGPLMPRDWVLVAGATGSVGSIVVQLAMIAGCHVVGLGGGEERCAWVRDMLGADDCVDYRSENLGTALARVLPGGIDVFSDGIGGDLTLTAARLMNVDGRFLSYGAAAAFYGGKGNAPARPGSVRPAFGITDEVKAIFRARNIKSEAWVVDSFYHERLKAEDDLSRLMLSGKLKPINTVVDGFDNLPDAIIRLYRARRAGKLQVRFDPRPSAESPAAPG